MNELKITASRPLDDDELDAIGAALCGLHAVANEMGGGYVRVYNALVNLLADYGGDAQELEEG